ncbi:MAG: GDYXXLXY domain-containing protein [Pseudomonadota bacterium]
MRAAQVIESAVHAGALPAGAAWPAGEARPWPVVLLTALGAWLAAVPLLGVVALLLGDIVRSGAGPYVVGLLVLAGSAVVLRARGVPLFVEQLAVPGLLVGLGSLSFALFRDLQVQAGAAVLAALSLGLGWGLPHAWLRVLLGAAGGVLVAWAVTPLERVFNHAQGQQLMWLAWHLGAVLCAAMWGLQRRLLQRAQAGSAAAMEPLLAGWTLATLAGLAVWSGMSLLVGASAGDAGSLLLEMASHRRGGVRVAMQAASTLLSLGAAALLAWHWPSLRRPAWAMAAVALAVLGWFLPALGMVLLAAAWCAGTQRWRLAAAAALAAAWIVGSFYYRLQWTLSTKALVLVGVGTVLATLAWWTGRSRGVVPQRMVSTGAPPASRWGRAGYALCAVAVLGVCNVGIWQKETLIARGEPVFLELAPVDPRSLMQGDYMRLNFRVPAGVQQRMEDLVSSKRPRMVVRRDARGVASPVRLDEASVPLQPDELRIELTPKAGRWTVVTDAWFFEEGTGARYEAAKYGEFRVDARGRALLVGLRDAQLRPL